MSVYAIKSKPPQEEKEDGDRLMDELNQIQEECRSTSAVVRSVDLEGDAMEVDVGSKDLVDLERVELVGDKVDEASVDLDQGVVVAEGEVEVQAVGVAEGEVVVQAVVKPKKKYGPYPRNRCKVQDHRRSIGTDPNGKDIFEYYIPEDDAWYSKSEHARRQGQLKGHLGRDHGVKGGKYGEAGGESGHLGETVEGIKMGDGGVRGGVFGKLGGKPSHTSPNSPNKPKNYGTNKGRKANKGKRVGIRQVRGLRLEKPE